MKRNARFSLFALTAAACLASVSCQGVPRPDQPPEFVEKYELEGFPYPERFEFRRGFQYAPRELAGKFEPTWIGYYQGPGRPADHVPFFIREMQARGWQLREIIDDAPTGKKTLDFVKEEKGTTIELSRVYDGSSYGTSACLLKAEVRTLGLESFSIEENLSLVDERSKKSSGTTGESQGTSETVPPAPGDSVERSRVVPTGLQGGSFGQFEEDGSPEEGDPDVHLVEDETSKSSE